MNQEKSIQFLFCISISWIRYTTLWKITVAKDLRKVKAGHFYFFSLDLALLRNINIYLFLFVHCFLYKPESNTQTNLIFFKLK